MGEYEGNSNELPADGDIASVIRYISNMFAIMASNANWTDELLWDSKMVWHSEGSWDGQTYADVEQTIKNDLTNLLIMVENYNE